MPLPASFIKIGTAALVALQLTAGAQGQEQNAIPSGPQTDGPWRKVILAADEDTDGDGKIDDSLNNPMEIAVANDGRVFLVERAGLVKAIDPKSKKIAEIGKIKVFDGLEDGLLGIALDPNFSQNNRLYLFYSDPETKTDAEGRKTGENRVSRFELKDGKVNLESEKVLVRITTQRVECCHSGGSLAFDSKGNLYASTGDNTHPGASDGYTPIDERPERYPWNAQKSASNANDLRGKIVRVHPEEDGAATIPKENLFPPGKEGTRPEIYVMGNRNPFRISVDQKTGYLYWGEVGPDAGGPNETRGPAGFDEINQARAAGNFGWPYFIADNKAYAIHDFEKNVSGEKYAPLKPLNHSKVNTGISELPPAQPAFIYYPYGPSTRFPVVGDGGRTAMAGPVYYFDANLDSANKLPVEFNHTLFIYEWTRNWIIAVHLDDQDKIKKMERFASKMTFKRPMDMELGPDGCLYILENGTGWQANKDTQLVRIEYHPEVVAQK
ncbi:MAG: PQQ-dependent sugar dehydrogenase [Verrucomicrobiales bacterium]